MNHLIRCMISLFFLLIVLPIQGEASESMGSNPNEFAYEVVLPENQKRTDVGYYDLVMKAGETQTLQLKLFNLSSESMKISLSVNSAKTNGNGLIEYGENQLETDSSLTYDIKKLVTAPKEVLLAPHSKKMVELRIDLPAKPFIGYLAGGIQLTPFRYTEQTTKEEAVVLNEFAYVIGLLISESDSHQLAPEMALNGMSLKKRDGQYGLSVSLSNVQPVFLENLTTQVRIRKKGTKAILFEKKQSDMRMAPNSVMNFPVELEGTELDSGDYVVEVTTSTTNGEHWMWKKEFTFSKLEAQRVNEINNLTKNGYFNQPLFLGCTLVLCIVISGSVWVIMRRNTHLSNGRRKRTGNYINEKKKKTN
ncbi:hypothetical protein DOK67_0001071 [Enterococcus sp. DIV0212c]|nr:DUF916 and DUF3324 domain-containing protein [Enterococcus sp. DIV0212c]